jgi:hypothetical protein
MSRWVIFLVCAIFGLALLFCGLLVPAHLRAVDAVVLQRAGRGTPTLVEGGLSLVQSNQLGAAQLFATAAQRAWLADAHKLNEAVEDLARRQPGLRVNGRSVQGSLGALLGSNPGDQESTFTEFIVLSDPRTKALKWLTASSDPLVQSLLLFRSLTNTVLFPPSASTSGQALDAAIAVGGMLTEAGHLSTGLSNAVLALAAEANRTWNPQPLEQVLMDLMSVGQRFNWGQLAAFVEQINDAETLRVLANQLRRSEAVPVVYAAVCLTGNAAGVAKYLTNFSETGLNDLRWSLRYGAGGVNELVERNQRLCNTRFCEWVGALTSPGKLFAFALDYAPKAPQWALAEKWVLYLLGGFFVAAAFHFVRRVPTLEKPLQVRGFHLAREFLFALGFLLVVLLLSEPFLSQGGQKGEFPFRLQLPMVGGAAPAGITGTHKTFMNQVSLLTLFLFFVLQGLIYIACLVKLAEIRRQRVPTRTKLKLLENEDHLFDAGLYLGFVGTIISLILVSLGVIQFSLMAAYSCTCFGIVFVVVFKIFHLRPLRRKMLLEAEAASPEAAPQAAHAHAAL